MILSSTVFYLVPQQVKDLFLNSCLPEKQPSWLKPVGLGTVLLIAFTWYKQAAAPMPLSWVMTAFLTAGLIKLYFLWFHYDRTRSYFVRFLLGNVFLLYLFFGIYEAVGIAFIVIGFVFF